MGESSSKKKPPPREKGQVEAARDQLRNFFGGWSHRGTKNFTGRGKPEGRAPVARHSEEGGGPEEILKVLMSHRNGNWGRAKANGGIRMKKVKTSRKEPGREKHKGG